MQNLHLWKKKFEQKSLFCFFHHKFLLFIEWLSNNKIQFFISWDILSTCEQKFLSLLRGTVRLNSAAGS